VRETTLKSQAPALVYEEGSLTKRAIRDLYNKDIDEVVVAGADGYHEAADFMRTLMPTHTGNIHLYQEPQPDLRALRHRAPTRCDVLADGAIEVRRLHRHEPDRGAGFDRRELRPRQRASITSRDTALKTNLEAAEEIARQLVCAISPASSSSTSSTWRRSATTGTSSAS